MFDCHMHTKFSLDGKMTVEEACNAAVRKGLSGIAITDHLDFDYPGPEIYMFDFNEYFNEIEKVSIKYKNKLKILKSLEVGYQPHVIEKNYEVVKKCNFDYVLSSVHIVNSKDPFVLGFYEGITVKEACSLYLNEILDSIKNYPHFDILGHIDYIRRYLPTEKKIMNYIDHKDLIDEILTKLISMDKGIEFNTGGIRYKLENIFTDINIFKRYKELGGEKICLGSDAHATENIADGFLDATALLKDIGFKYFVHFENRKAVYEKI